MAAVNSRPYTQSLSKRGFRFEVTRYNPLGEKPYYRVGVEDASSPVGYCNYVDRFPRKADALAFVQRQAAAFAMLER